MLLELHKTVQQAAVRAELDTKFVELVQIRGSQLNECACCLDIHTREARELGESAQRLHVLAAWRETALYSEQERAALAPTEAMSTLSLTQYVPDAVYQQAMAVFTEEQYATVA